MSGPNADLIQLAPLQQEQMLVESQMEEVIQRNSGLRTDRKFVFHNSCNFQNYYQENSGSSEDFETDLWILYQGIFPQFFHLKIVKSER